MGRKTVVVCDECERIDREVTHYRVTFRGQRFDMDLCEVHAKPLLTLLEKAEPVKGPSRFEDMFSDMESIEAEKQAAKKQS